MNEGTRLGYTPLNKMPYCKLSCARVDWVHTRGAVRLGHCSLLNGLARLEGNRTQRRLSAITPASLRLPGPDMGSRPSPSTTAFPAPIRRSQNASAACVRPRFLSIPQTR